MIYLLFLLCAVGLIHSVSRERRKNKTIDELKFEFSNDKALHNGIFKYAIKFITNKSNYSKDYDINQILKKLERNIYINLKQNILEYPILFSMNNKELKYIIHDKLIKHHVEIDLTFWKDFYTK